MYWVELVRDQAESSTPLVITVVKSRLPNEAAELEAESSVVGKTPGGPDFIMLLER